MNLFNWIPALVFTVIVLCGFVAVCIILLLNSNMTEYKDIALIMFGNLSGMALTGFGAWVSNIRKDEATK